MADVLNEKTISLNIFKRSGRFYSNCINDPVLNLKTKLLGYKKYTYKINTEANFIGISKDHELSCSFSVLKFSDGSHSYIPYDLVDSYLGKPLPGCELTIGKCSGIGQGSKIKYDGSNHQLIVGRYVSMGQRIKFILGARHNTNMMASCMLRQIGMEENNEAKLPPLENIRIGNDVWIGDEAMIMGGAEAGDGCVIGARTVVTQNAKLEPYGIYVGSPARLVKFRFSEKIIELLLQINWWNNPVEWLLKNTEFFTVDLNIDEKKSLELLEKLKNDAYNFHNKK